MEVFIDRCEDYQNSQEVIEDAFESLGGLEAYVKKGDTVLVNPNLLKASAPDQAVVTHPDFIISVVKELEKKDVDIIVGDSPAGRMTEKNLENYYKKSGWHKIEEETTARLNYDVEASSRKVSSGRVTKEFKVMKVLDNVNVIVNLPKLKTHSLTVFTGAVKNKFGLVPGLTKAAHHGQFKRLNQFGRMLLDLNDAVTTDITIMDGIVGMEGKGPSGGDPVKLNCVIASKDELAVDYAACKLTGIPPQKVPTLMANEAEFDDIDYINRSPNSFNIDIEYPSGGKTPFRVPHFLQDLFSNLYLDRPSLDKDKCVKCWECQEICPKNAIKRKAYGPKISWWKCIRCYSCTEACPEEALAPKS
ncbi:MAG: DUF362 domain-containing protein [Thermoplasmata archaeon]